MNIETLQALGQQLIAIVTALTTIASIICAATHTPDPSTRLGKAYKLLEAIAFNFGRAKHTGVPEIAEKPQAQEEMK